MARGASSRLAGAWPIALASAGVAAALLLQTTADPDLWGKLAFGRETLAHGIPRHDVFSYTAPGVPFLDHEWLSDVVIYALFHALGPLGIVALKTLVLAAMLLVATGTAGDARTRAAVAALVVVGGFPWFVTARPQLFTFLFFALFLLAAARADAGDLRLLAMTPPCTALWVNLHGGVVAGLVVLAVWGAMRVSQAAARAVGVPVPAALARGTPPPRIAGAILLVLLLHLPAALANPYGPALWRFFAETLTARRAEIAEWQPARFTDPGDALGLGVVLALGAFVLLGRRPRDPVHLVLIACTALATLGARRHLALAILTGATLGAPSVAAVLARGEPSPLPRALPALAALAATALFAVGLARAGCIALEPGAVPRAAVAYLKAAGVDGNLAVLFDWGDYAIWHLTPHLRVSIDGRREAVYSPAHLRENAAFLYGTPDWRAGLDRDGADLALMSPRFAAYARLAAAPDWRLAFADETAGLFVRRDTTADARLARTAPPAVAAAACLDRAG